MFIYKNDRGIIPELCQSFIDEFEKSDIKLEGKLFGPDGLSSEGKKSTDISFNPSFLEDEIWAPLLSPLIETLQYNLESYLKQFEVGLMNIDPIQIGPVFNMQRYLPNEGFFKYHSERSSVVDKYLRRVLVWMVYLNDVTEGGETEFYYQHVLEKPRQGTLLIWPADWMYVHRGHTSKTQTKYILTGWIEHPKPQE